MDLFYLSDTTTAFNNKWPQMNEIGMKRLISEHLVNDGLFFFVFLPPRLKDRGHHSLSFGDTAVETSALRTGIALCVYSSVFFLFFSIFIPTLTPTSEGRG